MCPDHWLVGLELLKQVEVDDVPHRPERAEKKLQHGVYASVLVRNVYNPLDEVLGLHFPHEEGDIVRDLRRAPVAVQQHPHLGSCRQSARARVTTRPPEGFGSNILFYDRFCSVGFRKGT